MKFLLLMFIFFILEFTTFADHCSCQKPYEETTLLQPNKGCSEKISPDGWTFFTYPLEGIHLI